MKSKQEEKPLKLLIDQLLIAYGLENKLNERRLLASWEQVVGKMIARHTDDITLKKDVLFLKMNSAAIRQEMSYAKEDLIRDLNASVGKNIIRDIVFR